MKFKQIGIRATDIEQSKEFYTNVLGFKILHEIKQAMLSLVFLEGHGLVVELLYAEANKKRSLGAVDFISFDVKNLDEKIAELKTWGIELDGDIHTVGSGKMAFFTGPNGERFQYFESF